VAAAAATAVGAHHTAAEAEEVMVEEAMAAAAAATVHHEADIVADTGVHEEDPHTVLTRIEARDGGMCEARDFGH
tara:strand:+ start:4767 stop:4991 length:225 start_codon:yes stop_codon:yes gene_type:complete